MRFTRPRRKLLFGTIAAMVIAVVAVGVLYPRSAPRYEPLMVGWPVIQADEATYYAYGLTEWLLVREKMVTSPGRLRPGRPFRVRREYRLTPGVVPAGLILAAGTAICVWAHRRLVGRLALRRYCDGCGYDLRGLAVPRCPECGEEKKPEAQS